MFCGFNLPFHSPCEFVKPARPTSHTSLCIDIVPGSPPTNSVSLYYELFRLGTCHDEVNNFRCSCPDGYLGRTCSNSTNECSLLSCRNGATCQDLHLDYNVRVSRHCF